MTFFIIGYQRSKNYFLLLLCGLCLFGYSPAMADIPTAPSGYTISSSNDIIQALGDMIGSEVEPAVNIVIMIVAIFIAIGLGWHGVKMYRERDDLTKLIYFIGAGVLVFMLCYSLTSSLDTYYTALTAITPGN